MTRALAVVFSAAPLARSVAIGLSLAIERAIARVLIGRFTLLVSASRGLDALQVLTLGARGAGATRLRATGEDSALRLLGLAVTLLRLGSAVFRTIVLVLLVLTLAIATKRRLTGTVFGTTGGRLIAVTRTITTGWIALHTNVVLTLLACAAATTTSVSAE